MRTVSFVGHVDLEVHGGVSPSALTLADVDNDGENELVVGTETGELYIFKGLQTQPLCHVSDLGLVSAVCCGPLISPDRNTLAAISGNGWIHMFEVDETGIRQRRDQRIPANVKTAVLSDVDRDGRVELVVALTDRVVRVYRWQEDALRAISKCELMQQIGNISLNVEEDGWPSVLVSQPGAAVVRLRYRSSTAEDGRECHSVEIDDVSRAVKARHNVSCEVLGGLREAASNTYAMITLDGSLFYVKDNELCWSMPLHHQLFCLTKLDVTSDGNDELIVTSWDGHTFIINQEKQAVQFLFEEPVTAFAAGRYGSGGANAPCMAYAAVGKVVLFHSVRLPVMVTETLTDMMEREHPWPGDAVLTQSQKQAFYRWLLYGFPAVQAKQAEREKAGDGGQGKETTEHPEDPGDETDGVPRFQPAETP
ncbi:KICSTOR complex protein ITFG2-like [Amphibalanus amphitrite]|uniref:KICSTOR complex protein ITFG2-like n=1 Tax=Amphibalanus amphitrite TaxID=1232801 RepID=UPI001C90FE0A|nr:KICSTOR complex protein ITFG2-like [Amphibalanus amphitrite]